MKLVKKTASIFNHINGIAAALAAAILLFAVLITNVEIATRYFWNCPIIWAAEITEYSLLYVTFLAAAWVLKREGHVSIDLVLNRLRPGTQALIHVITSIAIAIACPVLIWYTTQTTWTHFQRGIFQVSFLNIPDAYILVIIPIGYLLLFIQLLMRISGYLRRWKASREQS